MVDSLTPIIIMGEEEAGEEGMRVEVVEQEEVEAMDMIMTLELALTAKIQIIVL
jgi:hypothetical protein